MNSSGPFISVLLLYTYPYSILPLILPLIIKLLYMFLYCLIVRHYYFIQCCTFHME